MILQKPGAFTSSAHREQPTLASVWLSVAGTPVTEEFIDWPPDMFALTEVLLSRSEAYRFVLSPPPGATWPPPRIPDWPDAVEAAGRQWSLRIENGETGLPDLLAEAWRILRERIGTPLEDLGAGRDWRLCEALLTLHAIADEACAGLGVPLDGAGFREGCVYRAHGRELLARTGSLARIDTQYLRVLPRIRTPPAGTLWRAFSRYACVHTGPLDVRWHKAPVRHVGTDAQARHANFLLLPWPLRVRGSDFHALDGSLHRPDREPFGFFEFAPSEKLDLDLASRLIVAARDEVDSVDVVILPESAVDESEVDELEALLDRHGVAMLITGVRQQPRQPSLLPSNWVHLGVNPRLEKGVAPTPSTGEQWFHLRQNKHQRWSLDEKQIYQYHLGASLHPHIRWWEAMEVNRRVVEFVELGEGTTLVFLVCEDLAQSDDIAHLVRRVGPTLIYAPLLDGPQLSGRWAARYASVMADDAGSAVITLTAHGMAERSRPHGRDASRIVASWTDPVRGLREIPLEPGAQGVLLSLSEVRALRCAADGRRPVDDTTEYLDVALSQVRTDRAPSPSAERRPMALAPRTLGNEELTILTGWAQALADALVYDPGRVEALLADARGTTNWRARLGLGDPSALLSRAIELLCRAVSPFAPLEGDGVDKLRISLLDDRLAEDALDRLTRRVMRSTLEQISTR